MMKRVLNVACLVLLASCAKETASEKVENKAQSATIDGVVREIGTELPISGVTVFLVRPSDQPRLQTTTNGDGHFVLEGLDQGRHLVALVRDGYVVPGRLENSGYPFRVTAGQKVSGVVFHLAPAGTISGRVFSGDGRPANRVEVQLLHNLYVMGRRQWSVANRGGVGRQTRIETNELGEFRALGVDPGKYVIRFVPHEVTVESFVSGGKSPAPLLYPGVRDIFKAGIVEVKPGKNTLLEDLTLVNRVRQWIRVAVINKSGEPLENFGSWHIEPSGWIGAQYPLVEQRVVNNYREIEPDSPGTYDITATWSTVKGSLATQVRVNYQGIGLTTKMTLEKPQSNLTGSVVLQEKEGASPRPLAGVEVAIGPDIPYFIRSAADGTLTLPALYPGRYKLGTVRGLPPGTFVLRVSQGARDVLKEDLQVEKGQTKLDIVISTGASVLQGKVVDAKGQPVHNALVALVPEGVLKERFDYYGAYESSHTDQNGAFSLHGITPGSYQAYAWAHAPAAGFRSAEFMKPFAGKGSPVKLEWNGSATIELKTLDSIS
jgi:protocatechuate 3,4-dioxygenase beta subunit